MQYYAVEPWGFPVQDLWHGIRAMATVNAAGGEVVAQDFMLGEKPEVAEPDQVDFLRKIFPGFSPPEVAPALVVGADRVQGSPVPPAGEERPRTGTS